MPAIPQQRRQASMPTISRELPETPSTASHLVTARAAPQASTATAETDAGKQVAPAHSPLAITAVPTTRLPPPVFPKYNLSRRYNPPWAARHSPASSPPRSSFDHGSPVGDQTHATTSFRAYGASPTRAGPWWGGNAKRIPPLPRHHDIGKGRDTQPSYAAATESSSRRSRQPLRSSNTRPSSDSHRGADVGRGGGPDRLTNSTPPHLRPGYVDTDALIARLLKPHPKLVAQAAIKEAQKDESAPRQRSEGEDSSPSGRPADLYRPATIPRPNVYRPTTNARSGPEPERANDRERYLAWSKAKLLREVDIRRLDHEYKDAMYLTEILLVNDRKFFEKRGEYRRFRIKELLKEAEAESISLAPGKYWEHGELLLELAEKVAQLAVIRHNGLRRAEAVAQRQLAQPRVSVYADRPSRSHQVLKMTKTGHKLKDPALKNQAEAEPSANTQSKFLSNTATVSVAKEKKLASRRVQEEARKKSTETRSSTERKAMTFKHGGSQHDDSGYFTSDGKSSASRSTSATSSIGDEDESDELPVDRAKERTNTRRDSKQDSPKQIADKLSNKYINTKKHARTVDDQDGSVEKPSKKMKTSAARDVLAPVAKTPQSQQSPISSPDHDEEVEANVGFSETTSQPKSAKKPEEIALKRRNAHEAHTDINSESTVKTVSASQSGDVASVQKPALERETRAADTADDEDEDSDKAPSKPTGQGKKRKAERELTPDSDASSDDDDDSVSPSSNAADRPKKQAAGRRGAKVQKTTVEPKKLRGILASERIPGMAYMKYADGSWYLKKKSAAARMAPKSTEHRYNYIK